MKFTDDDLGVSEICDRCDHLRTRLQKAEARMEGLQHADANGCITGDCPHENEHECTASLREDLERIAATARGEMAPCPGYVHSSDDSYWGECAVDGIRSCAGCARSRLDPATEKPEPKPPAEENTQ